MLFDKICFSIITVLAVVDFLVLCRNEGWYPKFTKKKKKRVRKPKLKVVPGGRDKEQNA